MKTDLAEDFEQDLCKIQNLVHAIKILNDDTFQKLDGIQYHAGEKLRDELLYQIRNNGFAVQELLNAINDIRCSERVNEYANAIYKTESVPEIQ